jgi:hypothetical protein
MEEIDLSERIVLSAGTLHNVTEKTSFFLLRVWPVVDS